MTPDPATAVPQDHESLAPRFMPSEEAIDRAARQLKEACALTAARDAVVSAAKEWARAYGAGSGARLDKASLRSRLSLADAVEALRLAERANGEVAE